ncbi:Mitochondrial intermediate peptidase (N-terminal) [Ectocarpus siliculosus]|uniref:Mitochondrial intermediate peptidase (N-terminal) n=1 Tax=Ectocarpus siliculosus TaxID=2880 RepID=D7FXL4_ECTSI|nr:Mitochondrial intermediate peptidase (N-terminal) [Ectocarpus siliculosus]|eukprot:CBJ26455.1 Mitochondrial intermediate peptidase (N-terminal) [Ectocarpus siliculosus]
MLAVRRSSGAGGGTNTCRRWFARSPAPRTLSRLTWHGRKCDTPAVAAVSATARPAAAASGRFLAGGDDFRSNGFRRRNAHSVATTSRQPQRQQRISSWLSPSSSSLLATAARQGTGRRSFATGLQGVAGVGSASEDPAGGALTPGVAGVEGLHRPEDFAPLAAAAVVESDRLRKPISTGEVSTPLGILRGVDAISNTVCSVIDAADFVRNAHADEGFRVAADEAFSVLAEYIQDLNADDSLYRALCGVVEEEGAMDGFTGEQRRVVGLHMAEFERGGIHLSGEERAEVVALQNEATRLERLFEHNILAKRAAFQVNRKDLHGIPEFILSRIPQPEGQPADRFTLLTDQSLMSDVIKNARSGALRRAMYLAGNSVAAENVQVLERLMAVRHKLALRVGFDSHAHRMASEKMAENPEEIARFLEALSAGIRDKAEQEASMLRQAKMEVEGSSELYAWDISYYMGYVKSRECNLDGRSLSEYFTLGGCLEGLRMVCRGLFSISLEQVPIEPGENWAGRSGGGVRKLVLRHEQEGVLGTIYLDLHRREGKFGHAAHFTVRCGCYQLPTVVLVCNFGLPEPPPDGGNAKQSKERSGKDDGRLMSHSEVETLFHEFGHALHSLLSRTELQHVSASVPDAVHRVRRGLRQQRRHYRTGEAPPPALLDGLHRSKTLFAGLGIQTQLLYATLDQQLFGRQPEGGVWSSASVADALQERIAGLPRCEGAFWHSRFGHFTGYGASYYAYLYAKMFTSAIWERHFAKDPLNSDAGELLWKELLIHGGAKDPHEMLRVLLGEEQGSGGDAGLRAGVTSLLKDTGAVAT